MENESRTNEVERLKTLNTLVETYETIAASSMRRIRGSVLQNRAFHAGLSRAFGEVKRAYKKEVRELMKKKRIKGETSLSLIKRNGKTAYVLLMANTGLYGDIINKVFTFFSQEFKKGAADAVVIGKMGSVFFEAAFPGKSLTYFDFPDNAIDLVSLKTITDHLARYEKIIVFHGVFKNLLLQQGTFSAISGDELPTDILESKDIRYLFEPELETIFLFFETEIFASLMEQVFYESRLAKLASRMMLLDRASLNIDRSMAHAAFERGKIHHRIFNKKQLDALTGMTLWER